jgi:hypothetical protein
MARYNTVLTNTSTSANTTISNPASGTFTEFTGSTTAVTIGDPTLYGGQNQLFWNNTASSVTLTSGSSAVFKGPASSGTTTQVMPPNTALMLYSDGANWVLVTEDGNALTATTGIFSGTVTLSSYGSIKALLETVSITGAAPTSTQPINVADQAVTYFNVANTNNFIINIRGNSTTTLASILSTGQSATSAIMVTNTGTPYYSSSIQVDGTASGVTTRWQGGVTPTSGNANSIDIYTITVLKTGAGTYNVFASQTRFA